MTTSGRIELMAPAGNFESMQAALDNGCDSIYFGVEQLNMRARATVNFVLDDSIFLGSVSFVQYYSTALKRQCSFVVITV